MLLFQPKTEFQSSVSKFKFSPANILLNTLLRVFAANFNLRPGLNKYLKSDQGWINFTLGIQTESGSVQTAVIFNNGKVSVSKTIPQHVDTMLTFYSDDAVIKLLSATPTEQIFMVLKGQLSPKGNQSYLNLFFFSSPC